MPKNYLIPAFAFCAASLCAQAPAKEYAIDAYPIGGKQQLEQVLETQLTLPKTLMSTGFEAEPVVYFDVDSSGAAVNMKIEHATNNALRAEIKRIFRLMKFARTKNVYGDPYVLNLKLSGDKYNHYMKQRSKPVLRKPMPTDSSYVIYSRADRSPEYYKGGEEGLQDYIRTNMEYPSLAVEKSIEGTAVIEFIVETNGYVTGLKLLQTVGAGCGDEALRVISQTKWQPALLNNKLVRYKTTYPITFNLRNVAHDATSTQMGQ